jgi:hypothetical protein
MASSRTERVPKCVSSFVKWMRAYERLREVKSLVNDRIRPLNRAGATLEKGNCEIELTETILDARVCGMAEPVDKNFTKPLPLAAAAPQKKYLDRRE